LTLRVVGLQVAVGIGILRFGGCDRLIKLIQVMGFFWRIETFHSRIKYQLELQHDISKPYRGMHG
jgi:hypothetical protein